MSAVADEEAAEQLGGGGVVLGGLAVEPGERAERVVLDDVEPDVARTVVLDGELPGRRADERVQGRHGPRPRRDGRRAANRVRIAAAADPAWPR